MALVELFFVVLAIFGILIILMLKSDPKRDGGDVGSPKGRNKKSLVTRIGELLTEAGESENGHLAPSKEVIMAMAQQGVNRLRARTGNGETVEDEADRWAREFLASSCAKLDGFCPDVLTLRDVVNGFCNSVEKDLDAQRAKLCEFNNLLNQIEEACLALEVEVVEVCRSATCQMGGKTTNADPTIVCRGWEPTPQLKCAEIPEEDFQFTVYDQYVDDIEHTISSTIN